MANTIDPNDPYGVNKAKTDAAGTLNADNATTSPAAGQIPQMPSDGSTMVKLSTAALNGLGAPQATAQPDLNAKVLEKAQTNVLGQDPNNTTAYTQPIQQATLNAVNNPLGYDKNAYIQSQTEAYNQAKAKALEAYRQQNADVSNTGVGQSQLMTMALQNATDTERNRQDLTSQLGQQEFQNRLAALGQANTASQNEVANRTTGIVNLGTVRGMAEGERSQSTAFDQQTILNAQSHGYDLENMSKSFGFDMAKMLANQDFQGAQSSLDREWKSSEASADRTSQNAIIDKQLALDKWKQENGQQFTATQAALNRALELTKLDKDAINQTALLNLKGKLDKDMLVTGKALDATQADLNRQLEKYKAEGDWANVERITRLKGELDSTAQQADQQFQEKIKGMDINAQREITKLQGDIDSGKLLKQQDFQATQAGLDRELAKATQTNDITAQKEITKLKADLDAQSQKSDQEYRTTERIATQSWQTGERVADDKVKQAMQYFDLEGQKLLAETNNTARSQLETTLESMRQSFELNQNTANMAHDEKMRYLDSQFAEAKAANDNVRAKNILAFTYTQDLNKMDKEFGFDKAKMYLQADITKAINAGDYEHAEAMQQAQFAFQANEASKDRTLKITEQQLQGKQIDLQGRQVDYNNLMAAVEAGIVDPTAAADAVKAAMTKYGVKVEETDPMAEQKAVQDQYRVLQTQYLMSHPEDGQLNELGEPIFFGDKWKNFNNYYNSTIYGEKGSATTVNGGLGDFKNPAVVFDNSNNRGLIANGMVYATDDSTTPLVSGQTIKLDVNTKLNHGSAAKGWTYGDTAPPGVYTVTFDGARPEIVILTDEKGNVYESRSK